MENAGVQQARQMVELWGKRVDLVEQLNSLDGQIMACSKGEVVLTAPIPAKTIEVAQKTTGNGNGQRRKKKRGPGPGRPKGSRNKPKTDQPAEAAAPAPAEVTPAAEAPAATAVPPEDMTASGKRFRNSVSMKDLICTVAQQHADGIKLDDLVQACYEAGYRSTSDRKGFVQNIRTNLNSLMNDGKVTKDDEKRYHVVAA